MAITEGQDYAGNGSKTLIRIVKEPCQSCQAPHIKPSWRLNKTQLSLSGGELCAMCENKHQINPAVVFPKER